MSEDAQTPPPDPGLRHMLKWVAIALAAAVLFAVVAVAIVTRMFKDY